MNRPGLSDARELSDDQKMYLAALRVIREGYSNPEYDLGDAAKRLYLSKRSLQRVFSRQGSKGFRSELTAMRMRAGRRLLRESALSIREISTRVGYKHQMHFAKAYKKVYGISPRDERRLAGRPMRTVV